MAIYLDVGVGQVQAWLDRSPDLAGRRGASSMLAESTSKATWSDYIGVGRGVEWNNEAGEVSGVVALKLTDASIDPSQVAREIIRRMRLAAPSSRITASWAEAATYVQAYPLMHEQINSGRAIESLPATNEHVAARRCGKCALDPAAAKLSRPDDANVWVCMDCRLRYDNTGNSWRPAANLAAFYRAIGDIDRVPRDLGELAARGLVRTRDQATRVAVFYADGNAVGAFIAAALESDVDKTGLVTAIDDANTAAFYAAVATTRDLTDGRTAVVPHLVAGDDILVSVPASLAWPFARAAITAFGNHISEWAMRHPGMDRLPLPTLSGSLVFHHKSSSLPEAIGLSAHLLKAIKKRSVGPTLGFIDLMRDAPDIAVHAPRPLTWIEGQSDSVEQLALQPRSHRKRLQELAAGDKPDFAAFERTVDKAGTEAIFATCLYDHGQPKDDWADAATWLLAQVEDRPEGDRSGGK